jgi:Endoribonuclease L-PSP
MLSPPPRPGLGSLVLFPQGSASDRSQSLHPGLRIRRPFGTRMRTSSALASFAADTSSTPADIKVNVYLNDLKDYAGMNEVFLGRFGPEPPVWTTIPAAGGIPGNSLVEIDGIAYI